MCEPTLIVGLIMGAASIGIGSAQASAQSAAAQRANNIARSQAIGRRHFESKQISLEKLQATKALQEERHGKVTEGIAARGRLQAAVAETGVGGGVVSSMYRNLNLDESSQLAALDVTSRNMSEAAYLKDVGSIMKVRNDIERLPAVQGPGLGIAASVIGGIGTGVSATMAAGQAIHGDEFTLKQAFGG